VRSRSGSRCRRWAPAERHVGRALQRLPGGLSGKGSAATAARRAGDGSTRAGTRSAAMAQDRKFGARRFLGWAEGARALKEQGRPGCAKAALSGAKLLRRTSGGLQADFMRTSWCGERGEGRADLRAEATGCGDDAHGDQGGDQAVLDGRRARLVLQETLDVVLHDNSPNSLVTRS